MPITAREMLKILKKDGWYIVSQEGSHIQLKHTTKKGKVTVPNHKRDLGIKTERSILKQAGLEK
ncbi:type II toxin-antitoxin system HicA family toxin [Faecalicoccus pleomorphus]|uniref:type II toxin-antitoxin system HicA family toxin n=1 Tax=Faecalicoccus pleomorphus TaxID=1323 RepID=UPI0022E229B9|nr:type II toxin-antitoxin system HicA family toxin [Faecalicoccus pleomorphus]